MLFWHSSLANNCVHLHNIIDDTRHKNVITGLFDKACLSSGLKNGEYKICNKFEFKNTTSRSIPIFGDFQLNDVAVFIGFMKNQHNTVQLFKLFCYSS